MHHDVTNDAMKIQRPKKLNADCETKVTQPTVTCTQTITACLAYYVQQQSIQDGEHLTWQYIIVKQAAITPTI